MTAKEQIHKPATNPEAYVSEMGKFVSFAVIVIVAIIGIFIFINLRTSQPSFPTFANTNTGIPSALANATSNPTYSLSLARLTNSSLYHTQQFTITYDGTLYVKPSGIVSSVATFASPVHVTDSKYGNDQKLFVNVTSIPIFGSAVIAYVNNTEGNFSCANFNLTAIAAKNAGKALFGNHQVSCLGSDSLVGINLRNLAQFNFTELQAYGLILNYTTEYQSLYNGGPCTYLAGSASQLLNGTQVEDGIFAMCVSDTYYVPLSYSLYLSGQYGTFSINLNETTIGNTSNESYADSAPG